MPDPINININDPININHQFRDRDKGFNFIVAFTCEAMGGKK
jgi:hypothetical protein